MVWPQRFGIRDSQPVSGGPDKIRNQRGRMGIIVELARSNSLAQIGSQYAKLVRAAVARYLFDGADAGQQRPNPRGLATYGVGARSLLAKRDGHGIGDHQTRVPLLLLQPGQHVVQERITRRGNEVGRIRNILHRLAPPINCSSSYSSSWTMRPVSASSSERSPPT